MITDERWNGEHGHLYNEFAKCKNPKCRFYARDPAIVAAHEKHCSGKVVMTCPLQGYFCHDCRFDGQNAVELAAHYDRGECVHELAAIMWPIYTMNYDVLDRTASDAEPLP